MDAVELAIQLGLLVLAALIAVVVIRRLSTAAEDLRDVRDAQAAISAVHDRVVAAIDPLVAHLDDVRRGLRELPEAREEVADVQRIVQAAIEEARAVTDAPGVDATAAALAQGLERTDRALDLVDHGLACLGDRQRDLTQEGQTGLKRGILAIRHGRVEIETATKAALAIRVPVPGRPAAATTAAAASRALPGSVPSVSREDIAGEG